MGLAERLQLLYDHKCTDLCNHEKLLTLSDASIDSIIDALAQQIESGNWQPGDIPNDLYFSTAQKLAAAITEGLGDSFDYDDPKNALSAQLRANLYQFSGAKSLTQAAAYSEMLLDENGKLKSFNQFRQDIEATNKLYNEQYLAAEYNNAVAQAQMANKWQDFAADDEAWLEYRTAGDDRVRPEHAALDGIVEKIDSPFWNTAYPPNDWDCRCTVIPAAKPANAPASDVAKAKANVPNPIFQNNVGKTGIIYKEDHPYFNSLDGIKELDAVTNYGMRSMSSIMKNVDDLPNASISKTQTDYHIWFNNLLKDNPTGVKDKMGTNILFDDAIKHQAEKSYASAINMDDIVQKPDEIWYRNVKGNDWWQYIKYYNDAPYMVASVREDQTIKAQIFTKLDKADKKARRGVLLYKK